MRPEEQRQYLIADVNPDGSGTQFWAAADAASPEEALRKHLEKIFAQSSFGAPSHRASLWQRGTARFVVVPHTAIRFFDVTVPGPAPAFELKAVGS